MQHIKETLKYFVKKELLTSWVDLISESYVPIDQ